jgi:hypothetical protein
MHLLAHYATASFFFAGARRFGFSSATGASSVGVSDAGAASACGFAAFWGRGLPLAGFPATTMVM